MFIETGKFYQAGVMKDFDPGTEDQDRPYYLKIEEGTVIPDGAVVEEGDFAIVGAEIKFDRKSKETTDTLKYYVKATDDIRRQIQKNTEEFARSLARHLHQKVREYKENGLDYFEEIKKQAESTQSRELKNDMKTEESIDEQISRQEAAVLSMKKKYDASVDKLAKLVEQKKKQDRKEILELLETTTRSYDEIKDFLMNADTEEI